MLRGLFSKNMPSEVKSPLPKNKPMPATYAEYRKMYPSHHYVHSCMIGKGEAFYQQFLGFKQIMDKAESEGKDIMDCISFEVVRKIDVPRDLLNNKNISEN